MDTRKLQLTEHDEIRFSKDDYSYSEIIDSLSLLKLTGLPEDFMGEPEHLGLSLNEIDGSLTAAYYIGANWLIPGSVSVVITPKVEHVDFIKMFLAALSVDSKAEGDYFSQCYGIDLDQPAIEVPSTMNMLSPLMIFHYISLLEKLTKHGLKKGYVIRDENLRLKVKGRILVSRNLKINVMQQKNDFTLCRYQEYTADIPENRLLKKALLFSLAVLRRYAKSNDLNDAIYRISNLLPSFNGVSDAIEVHEIKSIAVNKLFKGYSSAMTVAKRILRQYDYSLENASNSTSTMSPPFWIDMPRLFEMYVYDMLNKAYPGQIEFQVKGYGGTKVDFIKKDERLVLDAKYKPRYKNSGELIADIREISGYARDFRIMKAIGIQKEERNRYMPNCVIVYPDESNSIDLTVPVLDQCLGNERREFKHFASFYKIGIPLPMIDGFDKKERFMEVENIENVLESEVVDDD